MEILWIHVLTLVYVASLEIDECNQTIDLNHQHGLDLGSAMTFKHLRTEPVGMAFDCWFRLTGYEQQYIEVEVSAVVAGTFQAESCHGGYLRISELGDDSLRWSTNTSICGNYPATNPIRVKRLTRSSSAFVEFHVDRAEASSGFEFDALFIDKEPEESLPYGHIQRTDGKINSSHCDWLLPVDTCVPGGCRLVSPGYPGIYPPNTICRYTLINFDDARVQIKFGGRHGRKFDLKKSDGCMEDYVVVYDGRTSDSPLIGRYCGLGSDFIISSGTSIYLELHTGPGGPPYDYSGFDIDVVDRWIGDHDYGTRDPESLCDWSFSSRDSDSGELHTPDHMIPAGTTCLYRFTVPPGEIMEIEIRAYSLKPDCKESMEVWDGDRMLSRICADQVTNGFRGTTFTFTSKHHDVQVKYSTEVRHVSNSQPVWIYYKFLNATEDSDRSIILLTRNNGHDDQALHEVPEETTSLASSPQNIMTVNCSLMHVMIACTIFFNVRESLLFG